MAQTIWVYDDDSVEPFQIYTGKFQLTMAVVGVLGVPSATAFVDVPGTPADAYIIWTARYVTEPGDTTVDIIVNGGAMQEVEATHGWHHTSICCNLYAVYLAPLDISELNTGMNEVEIFNFAGPNIGQPYGATVAVISTDPSFPEGVVSLQVGLDGFFYQYRPPEGADSAVVCEVFPAALAEDHFLELDLVVSGVDEPNRPNRIWYQIGSGPTPTNLVGAPDAIVIDSGTSSPYPLSGSNNQNNQEDIDHFELLTVAPTGSEWACAQIESWSEGGNGNGASGMWHQAGFELVPTDPTAVGLMATRASSAGSNTWLLLPAAALLIVTVLVVAVTSRKRQAPIA